MFTSYVTSVVFFFKYIMLRQEMDSYPIIIGACAHTKMATNKMKKTDDECGWYIGKWIFMMSPMVVMALLKGTNSEHFWEAWKLKVSEYLYYVP